MLSYNSLPTAAPLEIGVDPTTTMRVSVLRGTVSLGLRDGALSILPSPFCFASTPSKQNLAATFPSHAQAAYRLNYIPIYKDMLVSLLYMNIISYLGVQPFIVRIMVMANMSIVRPHKCSFLAIYISRV